jgi:hypothetical protein
MLPSRGVFALELPVLDDLRTACAAPSAEMKQILEAAESHFPRSFRSSNVSNAFL